MSAAKILTKFESTLSTWKSRLGDLDDESFVAKPAAGGWCVGEICGHISSVSKMLLDNAVRCSDGDGEDKGFQFQPWLICAVGSLPPVKIRVPVKQLPEDMHHFANPESLSKSDGLAALDAVGERMRLMVDRVERASGRCRRRHPVGGWLHSRQWYHMTEMHLRHHLRQLERTLE